MRYYKFILNTNQEEILNASRVDLEKYAYHNTIASLNNYMRKNLKNNMAFCVYREDENMLFSLFAYDGKIDKFESAYEYILTLLQKNFQIQKIKGNPEEITMCECEDCIAEAKRREYTDYFSKVMEDFKLWGYDYYNDAEKIGFDFKEKIIELKQKQTVGLYEDNFKRELLNIETHENTSGFCGNMVHYIISSRSTEAAYDMAETLAQRLFKAKRIENRRMEIISGIKPGFYLLNNRLSDIIESNYGGVIVFDLSERFGYKSTEYAMAAKYIINFVKQYHNQCLFVFTYNMDAPGFSYWLLPELKKYIIPVTLREGTGNREQAVKYMEELIKKSSYAKYSNQASEYMKLFQEDKFTQTDVIMAYQQFEAWCVNKNILKAYEYNQPDDFFMDRDENVESSYEKLQKLIGLESVKAQIDNIIASDIVERERKKRRGKNYQTSTMHMIFAGNPGTAKTTVAKLFAGIAKEKAILKSGAFVEYGGMDLDGIGCVGKIRDAFVAAKGGVLFIDEAYSLNSDTAVTVLIQEMENQRDNVIVILAGYNERMQEFMEINEGLKSRIPHWIEFPDYSADELTDIFKLMIQERGFDATDEAIDEVHYNFEKVRNTDNFGNGRYARNLFERSIQNQSVRLLVLKEKVSEIDKNELFLLTKEDIKALNKGLTEEREIGTAKKELNQMVGLSSVKKVINKTIANYKFNKLCLKRGIPGNNASLHMVFTGNPGTAKTTVARLFAEIMKDEDVLSTGIFVEVGRAELVSDHVGGTAKLVKKKFKEAQGGVLFIDEAYALCDGCQQGFGEEAINTIVQEMENHRDNVIVIFAGYPEPMKEFLDKNPGMLSRIRAQIEFEDYTTEELCEIAKLMLSKKKMTMTESAMSKMTHNFAKARENSDYGNGRYVRKVLEEAEMNLAERVLKFEDADLTTEMITTIDTCDIPSFVPKKNLEKKKIGFTC